MAFSSFSLSGYNRSSGWQLDINLTYSSLITRQVLQASNSFEEPLIIVDYGCSEGENSITLFKQVIQELRKTSQKAVFIFHTDLPQNDWTEFNRVLNNQDKTYLTLPNTSSATIGRSFFNQLLPNNSVHVAYSAYAFHYLSTKPERLPGDFSFPHKNFLTQAFEDFRSLLRLRHRELVKGGTLTILVAGAGESPNINMGKILILPFMALVEQGFFSQSELMKLEWNLYAMKISDLTGILGEFSESFEVIELKEEKNVCPFYREFMEDKDLEKYVELLSRYYAVLMELQLYSILPEGSDRKAAMDKMMDEIRGLIRKEPEAEMFINTISIVLKKLD